MLHMPAPSGSSSPRATVEMRGAVGEAAEITPNPFKDVRGRPRLFTAAGETCLYVSTGFHPEAHGRFERKAGGEFDPVCRQTLT